MRPRPVALSRKTFLRRVWDESPDAEGRRAAGVDWKLPSAFARDLDRNLEILGSKILAGYEFSSLRPQPIQKKNGKKRIICIPTVSDRLVQRAIGVRLKNGERLAPLNVVSYGFIRGRSTRAAIDVAIKVRNEHPWAYKSDIVSFFDQIDRVALTERIRRQLGQSSLVPFLERAIHCELQKTKPEIEKIIEDSGIRRGRGLRQGMPLSPILSNFVLRQFDQEMIKRDLAMIRYADDFIVFCNSEEECRAIDQVARTALDKVKHKIPPLENIDGKTQIFSPDQPAEFLGFDIFRRADGLYDKRIPRDCIAEIASDFEKLQDVDLLRKLRLDYPRLAQKLSSMQQGYRSAYRGATNFDQLEAALRKAYFQALDSVLCKKLGESFVRQLTPEKFEFLGISMKETQKLDVRRTARRPQRPIVKSPIDV